MTKQLSKRALIEPIIVGKMGSVYGIRGWLRVFSSTEEAESIFAYQPWFMKKADQWKSIEVETWKHHNHKVIIKLRGIEDRESARLLTNYEIFIDALQLPALDYGDYYWNNLLKCTVLTSSGYQLGEVIDFIETGANDVLVVKAHHKDLFGIQERLIPFLEGQVIKKVDLTAQLIEVDWDPGF